MKIVLIKCPKISTEKDGLIGSYNIFYVNVAKIAQLGRNTRGCAKQALSQEETYVVTKIHSNKI